MPVVELKVAMACGVRQMDGFRRVETVDKTRRMESIFQPLIPYIFWYRVALVQWSAC